MSYKFTKMHGLGNDFVIFDSRKEDLNLSPRLIQRVSNRRFGIGCDQVLVLKDGVQDLSDITMEIYNADGTPAGACGNGTRCVAWLQALATKQDQIKISTADRVVTAKVDKNNIVSVDMGRARCQDIDLKQAGVEQAFSVYVGNPHVVIFPSKKTNVDLDQIAQGLQHHLLFPEGTNVELVSVVKKNHIKLDVWERGVGRTAACGSGACAATSAAFFAGMVDNKCKVSMPGGHLDIEVLDDLSINMTGQVCLSYTGTLDASLFE